MQVELNPTNVTETVTVVGSALLGLIVLAGHRRDRRGLFFGLLCLSLAAWKAFDFAYPLLTLETWVDAVSWALGTWSIFIGIHFFVSYSFQERSISF